tara:strand:- start:1686 stop:1841 length:156 start_codon:yes stop_codon:yes gene_type:complete
MKNFTSAISGETIIINMNKIVFIEHQNDKDSMWIHFDNGEKVLVKKESFTL